MSICNCCLTHLQRLCPFGQLDPTLQSPTLSIKETGSTPWSQSAHICTHQIRGGRFSSRTVILLSTPNPKRSHRLASTQGMLWAAQQMQGIQRTSNTATRWEVLSIPGCQVIRWLQSYALWGTGRLWILFYNFSQITEVPWETSAIKQDLAVRKLFFLQPILFPFIIPSITHYILLPNST